MTKRARLGSLIRLGGTLGLTIFLAVRLDWRELGQSITHLSPAGFWGAAGIFLLAQVVSTARWRQLAGWMGFDAGFERFAAWYAAGMFCNLVLPTSVGGDVVRTWYLAHQGHGPADGRTRRAATSVLLDRGTGLLVLIALAGIASLASPVDLPGRVRLFLYLVLGGTVAGMVLGLLASDWLGRKIPKLAPLIAQGWEFARKPRLLAGSLALSVLVQVASVAQVAMIGWGMGLEVPLAVYGYVVPLVTLLTLLPVSVNGMGLREAGYAGLLGAFGVGASQAVALSLLGFAATGLVALLGLPVVLWGGWPRVEKTVSATEPVQTV